MTTTGNLTGSLGGTLVMAADGSYSYDPNSIPDVENLSLGAHVETFSYTVSGRPRRRSDARRSDDHGEH